jgi:hypothetical protein
MKVRRLLKRIPAAFRWAASVPFIGTALWWLVVGYGLPSVTLSADQERAYGQPPHTKVVVHERSPSHANVALYVELCDAEVAEEAPPVGPDDGPRIGGLHWAMGVPTYGASPVVLAWKDVHDGAAVRQPVIFSANGYDHVSELELRGGETNAVDLRVRVEPRSPGTYRFRVVADVRNLNLLLGLGHSRKTTPLQSLQIGDGSGSHRHVFNCG